MIRILDTSNVFEILWENDSRAGGVVTREWGAVNAPIVG